MRLVTRIYDLDAFNPEGVEAEIYSNNTNEVIAFIREEFEGRGFSRTETEIQEQRAKEKQNANLR